MGEVYRARDTRLDRVVAIKVLPEALAADPQFRERFDREARAVAARASVHLHPVRRLGIARSNLHPDGDRIASAPVDSSQAPQDKVVLVFNFFDELRRAAPAKK